MAAESTEDSVGDEMSANGNSSTRDQWVSFEENCDVPLLPQPPSQDNKKKLHQIKNPSNITSKNIVSALTEARESQMSTMMDDDTRTASSHQTNNNRTDWDDEIAKPSCCCVVLYNHLSPKQAKTTQEVECLLDEDELAIVNSEYVDNNMPNQQAVMT
ncbi:uncharacterized protein LOC114522226 isoform X2 [Dendronephthya gigantea]|uniref:uncharacterized protein LOC114522226 isoform X2 n=1 Tax=Dendronephthya gigantea TaxID=151771 RepID=UPI00106D0A41|nr:uncharacterized protein LOC114522226 isoform X2 [Dendronephthya gigantea]